MQEQQKQKQAKLEKLKKLPICWHELPCQCPKCKGKLVFTFEFEEYSYCSKAYAGVFCPNCNTVIVYREADNGC